MSNQNISQIIEDNARLFGSKIALCTHGGGPGEYLTYQDLNSVSGQIATALANTGVQPDQRVAILCEPRPCWGALFFGIVRAGAVVVPLDISLTPAELDVILTDARPALLLVSAAREQTAAELKRIHDGDLEILSIEGGFRSDFPLIADQDCGAIHRAVPRHTNDAAVIAYTSGTMGSAKGVVTTCGNLLSQVNMFRKVVSVDENLTTVSILPLSHLFELTVGFLGVLSGGGRICYCNSLLPDEIAAAMRAQQATCAVTVPLFLKLLARTIQKEFDKQSRLTRSALAVYRRIYTLIPIAIRKYLFGTLHRRFGGRLTHFICGGAPLDTGTLQFFDALGIRIFQGYGLAEASPVIATNGPANNRVGSVGHPLPGVQVKIADNGEIFTRGPHVMRGYFCDDALTSTVIDSDGWLHTGDVGHLDTDGFLFVSGRTKNVIVLASGKKVHPEEIDPVLFDHPDIVEGCVVGAQTGKGLLADSEEVCAIAVLRDDAIAHCRDTGEVVRERVSHFIEQQALKLSAYKRPTRIVLRTAPLPRTSTHKIRLPSLRNWLEGGARP